MRRLVMWNVQTLDGNFDTSKPWELDFHMSVWGEELERFSLDQGREIGTLLFGRATYEGMAAHWTRPRAR
jgi:dihydrofolate reductase